MPPIHEGQLLKRAMKMDDRTAAQLAMEIGISRTHLYRLISQAIIDEPYRHKLKKVGIDLPEQYVTRETFGNIVEEGMPVYDLRASAGSGAMYMDHAAVPAFHINVPGYEDCNFGMHVYGHSMYPTIENGSLVLCKQVNDKGMIMWGEIYLIVTGDYRMLKRIQKAANTAQVICVSDNEEMRRENHRRYEPMEINRDDIRELYIVKGIIKKIQS